MSHHEEVAAMMAASAKKAEALNDAADALMLVAYACRHGNRVNVDEVENAAVAARDAALHLAIKEVIAEDRRRCPERPAQLNGYDFGIAAERERCAKLVEGVVLAERYRTWPQLGLGDRDQQDEIVKHCDALAALIRAG
jgi:hypothetical protein